MFATWSGLAIITTTPNNSNSFVPIVTPGTISGTISAQTRAAVAAEQAMPRKFLRITEVAKICGVDKEFVIRLEKEKVI